MMLLLATIEKSGTNFFRIALFNYLSILSGDRELKTYDDLTAAFPNMLRSYKDGIERPAAGHLLPDGVNDFVYSHNPRGMRKRFTGPMVCIVRNPLDQIVSAFHYNCRNMTPEEQSAVRPQALNDLPEHFAKAWTAIKNANSKGALLLKYEDMFEAPQEPLTQACEHYGLPIQTDAIALACDHASLKNAKKFEAENGFMHIGANPAKRKGHWMKKRFVRSGAIGQWKDFYTEAELAGVKARLIQSGVDLNDFRYEPMPQPIRVSH